MEMIKRFLASIATEFELHSMKLAGIVATAIGWLCFNQDLLFTLLALLPVADGPRAIVALAIAIAAYFGPRVARYWPQPDLAEPSEGES